MGSAIRAANRRIGREMRRYRFSRLNKAAERRAYKSPVVGKGRGIPTSVIIAVRTPVGSRTSFLRFKLRGFELLPRWDFHPLFMPAFAGRTLVGTYPKHYGVTEGLCHSWERTVAPQILRFAILVVAQCNYRVDPSRSVYRQQTSSSHRECQSRQGDQESYGVEHASLIGQIR
jgi:hypothetical protein